MAHHATSHPPTVNTPIEPHCREAEQGIIGSVLQDRDLIVRLSAVLTEDDFFFHSHKLIWRAMVALWERRTPADFVTLGAEIRRTNAVADIGGEGYLVECFQATPTAVHANYYAELVLEASERRRHLRAVEGVATDVYNQNLTADDLHERALARLHGATRRTVERDAASMSDIMGAAFDVVQDWDRARFTLGVSDIDAIIGGVTPGQLIVIGARPAVGKTSLGLHCAFHAGRIKRGAAIASFEMTTEEVGNRMCAFVVDVNMHRFATDHQYYERQLGTVTQARGLLSELPIYLHRRPTGELGEFVIWAKRLHTERAYDLLMVDYVGLMSAKGYQNRTLEIGAITRALKVLAGELGVVVLCLAQLNRDADNRRPRLSDLRDSGTLEQDADIVILLHREEREASLTLVDIAKHRNGPIGTVHLAFDASRARFRSVTP